MRMCLSRMRKRKRRGRRVWRGFAPRGILMSVRTHFEDKKDQIASLCQAGDGSGSSGGFSRRS